MFSLEELFFSILDFFQNIFFLNISLYFMKKCQIIFYRPWGRKEIFYFSAKNKKGKNYSERKHYCEC